MKNGEASVGKMNSNNNVKPKAKSSGATGEHMKADDPINREAMKLIAKIAFIDKDGDLLGTPGKKWNWIEALPAHLKPAAGDKEVRGFERQYYTKVAASIKAGDDKETTKQIAVQAIIERAKKTMEQAAKRSTTPRSKTPAKSTAERAANLRAKAEKAEKAVALESLQPKIEALAKRLLPDWNSATAQRRGLAMGKAKRAIEELGEGASEKNAYRLNKSRRAASRAKSVASREAKGNNASSVATGATTRRNYKKEISIDEFCKEGKALQATSTGTVTVRDVLDHFAAGRAAAKKTTGSLAYQLAKSAAKTTASKFTLANSNDE
jgi:hypothetical protein